MACALLKLPVYSSTLLPECPVCHPLPAQTPNRHPSEPSPRLFPGRIGDLAPSGPVLLQLTPHFPGVLGDHGVQAARPCRPPGLEHRTSPARADAERELR